MDFETLLKQAGFSLTLNYGNRSLFFDTVQETWVVWQGAGRSPKNEKYNGPDLKAAYDVLTGGKK